MAESPHYFSGLKRDLAYQGALEPKQIADSAPKNVDFSIIIGIMLLQNRNNRFYSHTNCCNNYYHESDERI